MPVNLRASAGIEWSNAPQEGPIRSAIDPATIDRARHGDPEAFEEIVSARMDAIYRLSYAILGNEADARDAAQETFVTAWRQLGKLRDPERFDAWLQRIAVNAARMTHRARRRRGVREIASSQIEPSAADPTGSTPTAPSPRTRPGLARRRPAVDPGAPPSRRVVARRPRRGARRSRSGPSSRGCIPRGKRCRPPSMPTEPADTTETTIRGTTTASAQRSRRWRRRIRPRANSAQRPWR